jgi:hypothetical protein
MTSEGSGEMFKGDSADTCAEKCPLMSIGGQAEGLACADLGERTPIGVSGNWYCVHFGGLLANDWLAAPRGYVTELVCGR